MTKLDSILNSRDISNKGPSSQSYGFPSMLSAIRVVSSVYLRLFIFCQQS